MIVCWPVENCSISESFGIIGGLPKKSPARSMMIEQLLGVAAAIIISGAEEKQSLHFLRLNIIISARHPGSCRFDCSGTAMYSQGKLSAVCVLCLLFPPDARADRL